MFTGYKTLYTNLNYIIIIILRCVTAVCLKHVSTPAAFCLNDLLLLIHAQYVGCHCQRYHLLAIKYKNGLYIWTCDFLSTLSVYSRDVPLIRIETFQADKQFIRDECSSNSAVTVTCAQDSQTPHEIHVEFPRNSCRISTKFISFVKLLVSCTIYMGKFLQLPVSFLLSVSALILEPCILPLRPWVSSSHQSAASII